MAIPVSIYVATLWLIRDRFWMNGLGQWLMPVSVGLIILAGIASIQTLIVITLILFFLAIARRRSLEE